MLELRHAGALPPDMTSSDIQAIELCAGPQCTACSLSQGFPSACGDRNMYESPNFQNCQNTLRSFRAIRPAGAGPIPPQDLPPPPADLHLQGCQDKSCILDLITSPSKGTPITVSSSNVQGQQSQQPGGSAPSGLAQGATGNQLQSGSASAPRHASIKPSGAKQSDKLPVDLTAPCDVR